MPPSSHSAGHVLSASHVSVILMSCLLARAPAFVRPSQVWKEQTKNVGSSLHKTLNFKDIIYRNGTKTLSRLICNTLHFSHFLGPTSSVWWGLCLQRPCPILFFSYFAVFGTFLCDSLWAVACSPQPITAWGQGSITRSNQITLSPLSVKS